MGSDNRWQRRGSRVLFAGGPQGRIRLTVDEAVRDRRLPVRRDAGLL
ncbi:hypothetical protein [Streptomyces sp. MBT53]|nr:hypothetical protein [Streptomyces sp. MBT53]MBK6012608.1 hypothetical protein [Streptomyces sp. MBT53]